MANRSGLPARLLAVTLLALASAPVRAADPILMLVLGFIQNRVSTMIEESASRPSRPVVGQPAPALLPTKPPGEMQSEDLRQLVDRSFVYLSLSQRNELMRGLEQALADPGNAPSRATIISQFVQIAQQVHFAHATLDRLTAEQKRVVAVQFTRNFRELPPDQQAALSSQLRQRALPVPTDLSEMMLAELANLR